MEIIMEALLVLGDIPAALEVKPGIFDHFYKL